MKIVKSSEAEWTPALNRGKYANRRKALGGERISAGLWELPPGKRSFPLHAHHVTEEALFVVSGHAHVRTPDGLTAIAPGDYVSFPAGGPAHQLVNDGTEPLVYLALSASQGFDAVDYPETGKLAVAMGAWPSGRRHVFRVDTQVDYFHGEEE